MSSDLQEFLCTCLSKFYQFITPVLRSPALRSILRAWLCTEASVHTALATGLRAFLILSEIGFLLFITHTIIKDRSTVFTNALKHLNIRTDTPYETIWHKKLLLREALTLISGELEDIQRCGAGCHPQWLPFFTPFTSKCLCFPDRILLWGFSLAT